MSTPATIPMIAPNGQSGDIPIAKLQDAQGAGFKVAVTMRAPDGTQGYIPADRVHDAAGAGFKMVPTDVSDAVKASYWDALTNPVGSGGRQQGILGGALQVGGQAIKTAAQPFVHPVDTLEGAYNMVAHPGQTGQTIVNQVRNDYERGGVPLAAENLGGQALGAYEGGRIAGAAANATARIAAPLASRAILLGKTPQGAYESALKVPPSVSLPVRQTAVQAGLDAGIPVSKAGMEKLGDLIDDANQKIADTLQNAPQTRTISPYSATKNLQDVRNKFATQVNPTSDVQAVGQSGQEFLDQFRSQPGGAVRNLSPQEAQAIKQGTYRVLVGKYGEQGSAAVEAQKALARGLKDEIANHFPEINNLNAEESRLLTLQPLLERAVNRIGNYQGIGIGTPIAGSAVKAVSGSGSAAGAAMVLKSVLDNPAIKSRLAISLSRGGNIPYATALGRVNAYSASLGSFASSSQENSTAASPNQ